MTEDAPEPPSYLARVTARPPERVHHPVFARLYERLSEAAERAGVADHRDRLLAGIAGRVVEVGAGNGMNFPHYPPTVFEVIAIEPEAYLRARAEENAARAPVKITVTKGTASHLPLEDAVVDAGVASLMLCSVVDQRAALGELRRVIKPGGELRFYEHVRAFNPTWARLQRLVDPAWTRIAGGCHLTRDTQRAIEEAGFVIEENDHFVFQPFGLSKLTGEHILGRARRP